ncbi:MAG: rod shape-determining protein RodA [Coriobacteriales bacterium]|jgi:rod shape determining protein RodA|nr:rod shape-determining protein RodA [Coriobacteriales bacterium]
MAINPRIENPSVRTSSSTAGDIVRNFVRVVNMPMLIVATLTVLFGLLIVSSAVEGSSDYSFNRQVIGVGIGFVLMLIIWRIDYHKLGALFVPLLIIDVVLILSPLLPIIGVEAKGAHSWISLFGQQIQPGELAKIVTILVMATMVSRYGGRLKSGKEYLKCVGILLIPCVCIMAQPDLGTGMVLFAIGLAALFTGGADWKWLLATFVIVALLIVGVIMLDPILDDMMGHDVFLKEYQMNRLLVFIDPTLDPSGVGYNLAQSKITVGSGGLVGKGLYAGTQSGLGFLPEAPTDFIFCVLAEELGFLGCIALLGLYAGLIACSFWIAVRADHQFGALIIMGIVGMWVFQILENIGMTIGLMPITGIPLPFMSYGSSFMLVNFMALGLVLSVWAHRVKIT